VAAVAASLVEIDCSGLPTREINRGIRRAAADGATEIALLHPAGRHNVCVALFDPVTVRVRGDAGWYCGGMLDGGTVLIDGNAGWGVAENAMTGRVEVGGNAGTGAGATMHGGELYVAGDAGSRAAISLKGGAVVVGGSVGYMSGFMMQRGSLVVCGDAGEALGDSMYEGTIYVAGEVASLGADAIDAELGDDDEEFLRSELERHELDRDPSSFRKIVSGRKLWNFSKKEFEVWKTAL
jgi:methylamine---glutamate N-methyltransferase subunit B